MTHADIWSICQSCATLVYDQRPPTARYADLTARLLFGTAAKESEFEWERQRSVSWVGDVGGFSLWQLELGSIRDSLTWLRAHPAALQRATTFLFADPHAPVTWVDKMPMDAILWAMRMEGNNRIGCLFSRLHYFRMPGAIPGTLVGQADYWKVHYNTLAGAGTWRQYVASWDRLCAPVAGRWPE